jgi:hypothetical protein
MEDVEVFRTEIQVKAFSDAKATAHHEIGLAYGKGKKVIAGRSPGARESCRLCGTPISELQLERELAGARTADRVEHVLAA